MSECSHDCSSCNSDCKERQNAPVDMKEKPNANSHIKKVIGIVSGKGGVGKSMVTSLLATSANKKGFKTGILDADITGPSIPTAFGVTERPTGSDDGLNVVKSKGGISIMSLNLLLENSTDPVIWRGPIIAGTVKQFWTDVKWGDVDFLFVDMPPGTGDVPLTVFQSLPVDGIVVVTSPQELVGMIVEKAVNMAKMMSVQVLGIVENMSYFTCPDCCKKHAIFGESHLEQIAQKHGIKNIARLPIDGKLAKSVDSGTIEEVCIDEIDALVDALPQ